MTRNEYLSALRKGLNFLSPRELEDVMAEFEEHFAAGLEHGKTEDELMRQLGEAARIIEGYRQEVMDSAGAIPNRPEPEPQPQAEPRFDARGASTASARIHESFAAGEVRSIEIGLVESDVRFRYEDTDQVRVDIEGDTANDTRIELQNGTLRIHQQTRWFKLFHWFWHEAPAEITLPSSFVGSIFVSTVSGDVDLPAFKGETLRVRTTSGDMKLGDCYAASLEMHTVSGDINLSKFQGDSLSVHTTSGDMDFGPVATLNLDIQTISGDIDQRRGTVWEAGDLRVKTVSGDIEIALNDHWKAMSFNTVSGDIELTLPKGSAPFEVRLDSMSGDLRNKLGNDPRAGRRISAHTVAGDLKIREG